MCCPIFKFVLSFCCGSLFFLYARISDSCFCFCFSSWTFLVVVVSFASVVVSSHCYPYFILADFSWLLHSGPLLTPFFLFFLFLNPSYMSCLFLMLLFLSCLLLLLLLSLLLVVFFFSFFSSGYRFPSQLEVVGDLASTFKVFQIWELQCLRIFCLGLNTTHIGVFRAFWHPKNDEMLGPKSRVKLLAKVELKMLAKVELKFWPCFCLLGGGLYMASF